MGGSGPGEGLGEEAGDEGGFVLWLKRLGIVGVIGFVPDIPAEDAIVFGEGSDDALYVGFEARLVGGVGEANRTGE